MKNKLAAITGFLAFLIMPFVSAAQNSMSLSIEWFVDKVVVIFITLNERTVVLFLFGMEASYLAIIATWLMLFSLIWVASGKIPPFKDGGYGDDSSSGARKMFAISVSLLVAFGSPMAGYITGFLRGGFNAILFYASILLTILGFWAVTKWFGWGTSSLSSLGADNATRRSDAGKIREESRKQRFDNQAAKKLSKREKRLANDLYGDVAKLDKKPFRWGYGSFRLRMKDYNKHLNTLKEALTMSQDIRSPNMAEFINNSLKFLSAHISDESREANGLAKIDELLVEIEKTNHKQLKEDLKQHEDHIKILEYLKVQPYHKGKDKEYLENEAKSLLNEAKNDLIEIEKIDKFARGEDGLARRSLGNVHYLTKQLVSALQQGNKQNALSIIPNLQKEIVVETTAVKTLEKYVVAIKNYIDKDYKELRAAAKFDKKEYELNKQSQAEEEYRNGEIQ